MEARGDVDAARQMGQLEAVWSAMGSRQGRLRRHILRESTSRAHVPGPSISGDRRRVDHAHHGKRPICLAKTRENLLDYYEAFREQRHPKAPSFIC